MSCGSGTVRCSPLKPDPSDAFPWQGDRGYGARFFAGEPSGLAIGFASNRRHRHRQVPARSHTVSRPPVEKNTLHTPGPRWLRMRRRFVAWIGAVSAPSASRSRAQQKVRRQGDQLHEAPLLPKSRTTGGVGRDLFDPGPIHGGATGKGVPMSTLPNGVDALGKSTRPRDRKISSHTLGQFAKGVHPIVPLPRYTDALAP